MYGASANDIRRIFVAMELTLRVFRYLLFLEGQNGKIRENGN
jgi:hypothetical protein